MLRLPKEYIAYRRWERVEGRESVGIFNQSYKLMLDSCHPRGTYFIYMSNTLFHRVQQEGPVANGERAE